MAQFAPTCSRRFSLQWLNISTARNAFRCEGFLLSNVLRSLNLQSERWVWDKVIQVLQPKNGMPRPQSRSKSGYGLMDTACCHHTKYRCQRTRTMLHPCLIAGIEQFFEWVECVSHCAACSVSNPKSTTSQWVLWERFGMWYPANDVVATLTIVHWVLVLQRVAMCHIVSTASALKVGKYSTQECLLPMLKNLRACRPWAWNESEEISLLCFRDIVHFD